MTRKFLTYLAGVMLLVIASAFIRGQTSKSQSSRVEQKEVTVVDLDSDAEDLAENYIYILEQIDFLTKDFYKYLKKSENEKTLQSLIALKKIAKELSSDSYYQDLARLNIDIEELQKSLTSYFENFENHDQSFSKTQRLARQLQEELQIVSELYEEEITSRLAEEEERVRAIETYLVARREQEKQKIKLQNISLHSGLLEEQDLENLKEELEKLKDEQIAIQVEMDGIEPVIVRVPVFIDDLDSLAVPYPEIAIEDIPVPPIPPYIFMDNKLEKLYGTDKKIATRILADSSESIPRLTPIYIKNPTGDLLISGWNRDYVRAVAEAAAVSDNLDDATKLAEHLELHIFFKGDRLFVITEVPKLKDPRSLIVSNTVKVLVPASNPVVCDGAFGGIEISDIKGGIQLNSENCEVLLDNIEGGVVAASENGNIEAMDLTGSISIKNSFGIVDVDGCEGYMEIENKIGLIKVRNSQGDALIRNNGDITIYKHSGNIQITNVSGQTQIKRLDGNLKVTGSYAPIVLDDVSGSATITNFNAPISASRIQGLLKANNKSASIHVEQPIGPLDLDNKEGNISIFMTRNILGESIINSTSGTVILKMIQEPNLILTASIIDGKIVSEILKPYDLNETGQTQNARWVFGAGANTLEITGTNATVLVSDL